MTPGVLSASILRLPDVLEVRRWQPDRDRDRLYITFAASHPYAHVFVSLQSGAIGKRYQETDRIIPESPAFTAAMGEIERLCAQYRRERIAELRGEGTCSTH